ncbi:MAG: DUF4345 family protein [Pseudomonadota bacterium]
MIDAINIAAMIATIAFGAIGWLAPRYTLAKLDLTPTDSNFGISEIRAANGALFVGLGAAALVIQEPLGYAMVGFAYAGAAIGRLTGIVLDRVTKSTAYTFCAVEIVFAAWLIYVNLMFG